MPVFASSSSIPAVASAVPTLPIPPAVAPGFPAAPTPPLATPTTEYPPAASSSRSGASASTSTLPVAVADPSTPWGPRFFLADLDAATPGLSPPQSLPFASPGYTRCSSEPPAPQSEMTTRATHSRSRSASRTPSLPANDSRTDLKSLPVTPKVEPAQAPPFLPAEDALSVSSETSAPTSPCHRTLPLPLATPDLPLGNVASAAGAVRVPHVRAHAPRLRKDPAVAAAPPVASFGPSFAPRHAAGPYGMHMHEHEHDFLGMDGLYGMRSLHHPLRSTQYSDLFLLEPHEYDSITDGELVRLYDRGVIDGRVLEQIVDASIRIQRACTDADRAVSIKTRRAMIRHALEE